jgi:2-polyprenyl-3-methyl-5-hydroxy-6-metoxy-1,4-benzoquinol methylase
MSFGRMPIANGFLTANEFSSEYFFEMEVGFCDSCKGFQLIHQPDPKKMFHENYAFFSSLSIHMQVHFKKFASEVMGLLKNDPQKFVIELGSNDGIMLKNFMEAGYRHLGIEPSTNVAKIANNNNIHSISKFFSSKLASEIIAEYGHADAITSANVMCHIPDINDVAQGISKLLKPGGFLVFEDPYLGSMIEKTSYDQIYDEHVFIFSAHSVSYIFEQNGMELIDVIPQETHGGSMRYVLAHKGAHEIKPSVDLIMSLERDQGLDSIQTFQKFKERCEKSKVDLLKLLQDLKNQGKRVIGYAATSKSTTILNYCGIGPDLIEFIADTTPLKQGKFSPGMHIPVKPYSAFQKQKPDYAVLFAWNHWGEIKQKEGEYMAEGGKWISFIPKVEIWQ